MKKNVIIIATTLALSIALVCPNNLAQAVTLYAEDGRSANFPTHEVAAQLTVGWYTEPVQRLYAEGKSKLFKQSEVAAQLTVGWYTEPVQRLYAEGKSKLFKQSEVAAQLTVGWYRTPPAPYKKAFAKVLKDILLYDYPDTKASFSLIYIDNNNIPELVYHTGTSVTSYAKVYVYSNNKAVQLTTPVWYGFGNYGDLLYKEKANLFASLYCGDTYENLSIYKIQNNAAKNICNLDGSSAYNGNYFTDYDTRVSYSQYMSIRRQYGFTGGLKSTAGYNRGRDKNDYALNKTNISLVLE